MVKRGPHSTKGELRETSGVGLPAWAPHEHERAAPPALGLAFGLWPLCSLWLSYSSDRVTVLVHVTCLLSGFHCHLGCHPHCLCSPFHRRLTLTLLGRLFPVLLSWAPWPFCASGVSLTFTLCVGSDPSWLPRALRKLLPTPQSSGFALVVRSMWLSSLCSCTSRVSCYCRHACGCRSLGAAAHLIPAADHMGFLNGRAA